MRGGGWARWAGLLVVALMLALGSARAAEDSMPDGDVASEHAAAILEAVSGIVEVQRDGEWLVGEEGAELALEDQVRTDADSFARLRFLDGDPDSGAEATLVDLSPDSTVSIEELSIAEDEGATHRTGLIGLLRGALHAITKGWSSGSLFSVRAGTTVCGIRGSVANVGYDPDAGEATVTSLDGEMYTFEARDRREALQRTRSAMRELRRGRRVAFLQSLDVGRQHLRNRRGRVQRRKIEMKRFLAARRAALDSRHGGLAEVRHRINEIARVRPPRRRPGRLARKRIEKRIQLRQGLGQRRRPEGLRERIRDRLNQPGIGGGVGDRGRIGGGLRDRLRRPPAAPADQPAQRGIEKLRERRQDIRQNRIQDRRRRLQRRKNQLGNRLKLRQKLR